MSNLIVIDVREPDEYSGGHADGALNLPLSSFVQNLNKLEGVANDAPIIAYCRSGARSSAAIEMLKKHGYTNLTNGINAERTSTLV